MFIGLWLVFVFWFINLCNKYIRGMQLVYTKILYIYVSNKQDL